MQLHEMTNDRQSQADAAMLARRAAVRLAKPFEDRFDPMRQDPRFDGIVEQIGFS